MCESRLYDDSFIGDGHLCGAAAHNTTPEEDRCYQHTGGTRPSQRARSRFAALYGIQRGEEQAQTNEREDCGDQRMPPHHDPVQPGLVLYGFARDEMLLGVAQRGSLKKASKNLLLGNLRRMLAGSYAWSTAIRCKTEKISNSVGSA